MEDKIRARLQEIRKYLQNDGGDLEIVGIDGKNVKLKLVGACGCCPHAMITLKEGIEKDLKEQVDSEIVVERAE
ncbi:MAG: NifU family protein [Victivallales bacterium]|nr:NifU family protein [Victivallales bacterium]MCF7889179.1 NifU family protein [Victivallales bacterium]